MNNDNIENKTKEIKASYISKEEFINILNNIEFVAIRECEIELLTGIIFNADDKEAKFKELYKTLRFY